MTITIAPTTDGLLRDAQDLLHMNSQLNTAETRPQTIVDVEHNPVQDDPRCWSSLRKVSDKLILVQSTHPRNGEMANWNSQSYLRIFACFSSHRLQRYRGWQEAYKIVSSEVDLFLIHIVNSCLSAAVEEMEKNLPATDQQFSLSISLFILFQGMVPLLWTAISEVKGRKVGTFPINIGRELSRSPPARLSHLSGILFGGIDSRCPQHQRRTVSPGNYIILIFIDL